MFNRSDRLQTSGVRIPLPWVICCCLLAIAIPAWLGMRGKEFLTPPDEETLAAIRTRAESSLPRMDTSLNAITPQADDHRVLVHAPVISLGNLAQPPQLNEYADRATNGSAHLIELANRLEDEGHQPRALLAWERIIDQANAGETEIRAATVAITRLRASTPPWNPGTQGSVPVVIHAGTAKKSAEALEPILRQASESLSAASGGTLTVGFKVNAGPDVDLNGGPVPVAIWISGGGDDAPTTEVRSFTVATPETLEYDAIRTIYALVQSHLRNSPNVRRPPSLPEEGDVSEALSSQITRLQWREFGRSLNAESP